jgi:hypothetical protein
MSLHDTIDIFGELSTVEDTKFWSTLAVLDIIRHWNQNSTMTTTNSRRRRRRTLMAVSAAAAVVTGAAYATTRRRDDTDVDLTTNEVRCGHFWNLSMSSKLTFLL